MQRIDHEAITTFGIPRLLLMDHAGLAVARAVRTLMPEPAQPCLVCCGSGYNGGDGLCAAWHLAHRGYQPSVVLVGVVQQLKEEPALYAHILQRLHVPIVELQSPAQLRTIETRITQASVIIDALLGIGVQGPMRPLYADLIALMNQAKKPIVSVDVPSGLDAETGQPHGIAVKASLTVTFGLPKHGLFLAQGPEHVGELVVDDIGIPHSLLQG
jgi:NAD(P)H-hydrate epimerase